MLTCCCCWSLDDLAVVGSSKTSEDYGMTFWGETSKKLNLCARRVSKKFISPKLFSKSFWWHKESRRSCQRKWFYQVQQENALVPYLLLLLLCSFKAFFGRPPVSWAQIILLLQCDKNPFKLMLDTYLGSSRHRNGRPGFSKAVFKSNFSSLIYLQKGLVSLMWK